MARSRFTTYFAAQSRARLAPRYPVAPLVSSAPDVVGELLAAADQLQDLPRPWLASREDLLFGLRRVAGRVRAAARLLEAGEVVAPRPPAPRPLAAQQAPHPGRLARRGRRVGDEQLDIFEGGVDATH